MDPLMLVSIVLMVSGGAVAGMSLTHLYRNSQEVGVYLPFSDYDQWQEWKDAPKLGEGLMRHVADSFAKDKAEIAELEAANEEAEELIVLLRQRIDALIADRAATARDNSPFQVQPWHQTKTIGNFTL